MREFSTRVSDDLEVVASHQSGDSPPVLLLHGLSQQRRFWLPVLRRLDGLDVYAIDARGHGDTGGGLDLDYSVPAAARDIVDACSSWHIDAPVVVGHSWGAWVALQIATVMPVRAVVAIDGGFIDFADLGDRETVKARLAPPRFTVTYAELMGHIARGPLAGHWTDDVERALSYSFDDNGDRPVTSRVGFDRHQKIMEGLVDYRADFTAIQVPTWLVSCEPITPIPDDGYHGTTWQQAREAGFDRARRDLTDLRILRWLGAIHDVPLAWPDMTAGLIRTAVAEVTP